MLMLTTPAQATETVVSLVRDMLLLEAEQARQNMSTCTPATTRGEESDTAQIAESPSKALTAMSSLELKAIYGRDTRLLAEVRQGQRLLVFQQGQLWPIGRDRDQHMRLLSLSNRCIELEVGQVQQQTESQGQGQTPALANTAPRSEQLPPQTIKLCLAS